MTYVNITSALYSQCFLGVGEGGEGGGHWDFLKFPPTLPQRQFSLCTNL